MHQLNSLSFNFIKAPNYWGFVFLLPVFLLFSTPKLSASSVNNKHLKPLPSIELTLEGQFSDSVLKEQRYFNLQRVTGIVLTLVTGPLGGHRIYFGTNPAVPVVYTLTLGAFGVLPLIDLFMFLFKRDMSYLIDNKKIIAWSKARD